MEAGARNRVARELGMREQCGTVVSESLFLNKKYLKIHY